MELRRRSDLDLPTGKADEPRVALWIHCPAFFDQRGRFVEAETGLSLTQLSDKTGQAEPLPFTFYPSVSNVLESSSSPL